MIASAVERTLPPRNKTTRRMRLIGLMSGTSADGIDAVLTDIDGARIDLLAHYHRPYDDAMRRALLDMMTAAEADLDRLAALDIELGEQFAAAALELMRQAGVKSHDVGAIGSHGQTVRHRPAGVHPFSLQLGKGAVIAARSGITTVNDFRAADIAAGGHGAPLVPAFHDAAFRQPGKERVIANIGGIANITVLPGSDARPVTGFDTGPGNALLDQWILRHRGATHDAGGAWGAGGAVNPALLEALLAEPYFDSPPPKSTGREQFSLAWLDRILAGFGQAPAPRDVQATLAELTARSLGGAIALHAPAAREVFLCGGGVHNAHLVSALTRNLPGIAVETTTILGIDPDWVEAVAFAWLAHRTLQGLAGNLPAVTGARYRAILGAIHPAPVARA